MTLPGATVETQDERGPSGAVTSLGTAFIIGELETGPETPTRIRRARDLAQFGVRNADTQSVHDYVDDLVGEGGGLAYVVRLLGADADYATLNLSDGTTIALSVRALYRGAFGNRISIDIDVSGSTFKVKVYLDGALKEDSGFLADGPAAAVWSLKSKYVRITDGPGGDPVALSSPSPLIGGDDDLDGITTAEIAAAAASFPEHLGTGSYVLPGRTASASYLAVAPAAREMNRLIRVQLPPLSDAQALADEAAEYRDSEYFDIVDLLAPALTYPGLTPGATRSGSPTAVRIGAECRNDRAGKSPNQPAAGDWGRAQYAIAPTIEWDKDDLDTLYDAGINVVRVVRGELKVYGSRTAADPDLADVALRIGSARMRMAFVEIAKDRAERVVFAELDDGGTVLSEHAGQLASAINVFAPSLHFLDVTAAIEEDEVGGYVEFVITFQAARDAERVKTIVARQITED
ncbi:MAG: hypothetical protein PGN13_16075 [Patulibacter minatonensis]